MKKMDERAQPKRRSLASDSGAHGANTREFLHQMPRIQNVVPANERIPAAMKGSSHVGQSDQAPNFTQRLS